ncbi:hypothetical protein [Garciella nitratireducens]|nr:hypothetical protein [Garciella nitratireducens]
MKKKRLISILSICLLLALLAPVSAAEVGYVGYKLPRLKGNNYTGYHQKATNDDYIRNIVENVSNTSTVNFWAQDHSGDISSKYNQKVGSVAKIIFNTNKDKGNSIRMAMENGKLSTGYAFVAGRVNFR